MNLLKKILISVEILYHLKNKKKIIKNWTCWGKIFWIYKFIKRIISDNLIYKSKTKGRSPKHFSFYQNPLDLFISLRHFKYINPKEVLENKINFKSDTGEIKKTKFKIKTRRWSRCNIKCLKYFFIQEKKLLLFWTIFFFPIKS